jgi:hypothetical protein
LQQQIPGVIKKENRKTPIQATGTIMTIRFCHVADRIIVRINEDQLL